MNSYLGFNPAVILNTINTKLRESNVFTGQDYSGSNFTALNDSLAWVISMLLFYLNRTSSNTTLDTNDYSSINRLSNIHGYKPRGALSASILVSLNTQNVTEGTYLIPRYSRVGQYVTVDDFLVSGNSGIISDEITMYEGSVVQHPIFYAKGNSFEKLIINAPQYIDHNFFHVYVKEDNDTWVQYNEVDFVILNKSEEKVFEKRLNENKFYEISFGDGINGRKLKKDEEICIFYLKPSGKSGEVVSNKLAGNFVKFSSTKFTQIMQDLAPNIASSATIGLLRGFSPYPSSKFIEPETVSQIKRNIPGWVGSRRGLIKKSDFRDRVLYQFPGIVKDCKVLTNDEYVNDVLKYYYDLGVLDPDNLERPKLSQLYWADSCNYNNLYVYVLPNTSTPTYLLPVQGKFIKTDLQERCGTQEIVISDPIFLQMYIGHSSDNTGKIILEREKNNFRSDASMISEAANIIQTSMGFDNAILGPTIRIDLLNELLKSIDGVKAVFTQANNVIIQGVSFILVNPEYSQDVREISQNVKLEDFFVPYFSADYSIKTKIEVRNSGEVLKRVTL
jgi:hypothetical protein